MDAQDANIDWEEPFDTHESVKELKKSLLEFIKNLPKSPDNHQPKDE